MKIYMELWKERTATHGAIRDDGTKKGLRSWSEMKTSESCVRKEKSKILFNKRITRRMGIVRRR